MKKKFSVDAAHQFNGDEVKNFDLEYDNFPEKEGDNNNRLLKLLDQPWQLIKYGGKLGVNGVKRFFVILALFSISNLILFFYSIAMLLSTGFELSKLIYVFLVLIIGISITAFSGYRTYQFVVIDTMRVIYENLSSQFKKIAAMIIDSVENLFLDKIDLTKSQLINALDFGKLINSKYQKFPKFLRTGLILVLNKVPYVDMVLGLKDEIMNGNRVEASSKLYAKMDGFISDSIFGDNNTNWVWFLLPLNIAIQLILIKYKIG